MPNVYSQHNPAEDSGTFLKLKDGDNIKMRIASEPAISIYKSGDRPRYSWFVLNRENSRIQIYSAGVSVFSQIKDIAEDWGDPKTYDVKIKRTGAGQQDTSYSVTPVKQSDELTEDQLAEVERMGDLPATIKGKWLADYIEDGQLPKPVKEDSADLEKTPEHKIEDMPVDEEK